MNFPRPPARRIRQAGLTLVELIVVVGMIAVLAAIAMPMYKGWQDKIKTKRAQDDIIAIAAVLDAFLLDNNKLPASLADIGRAGIKDPWGKAYAYLNLQTQQGNGIARKDGSLVPLNTDYDLYSTGPDGSTAPALTAKASRDDILRANNGRFIGPASSY